MKEFTPPKGTKIEKVTNHDDRTVIITLSEEKSNLEIAKDKYKVGMRCKSAATYEEFKLSSELSETDYSIFTKDEEGFGRCLYDHDSNNWAEILPLLTTEDGVEVTDPKQKIYVLSKEYKRCTDWIVTHCDDSDFLYFSTEEARQKYIDSQKEKDLIYYEDVVNDKLDDCTDIDYFKRKFTKIYWQMVLQEIANELCGEGGRDYSIKLDLDGYRCYSKYYSFIPISIRFDREENANKAIEIMGDKLDYIYKK
jgi:hypothetical protein